MQITEAPEKVEQLDLMVHLKKNYSKYQDEVLYSNIIRFVNEMVGPLLDRINAREMETFTLHNRKHALKVAHLMWHIISEERKKKLTPPEIALLVLSAYLHDLGMAISPKQRDKRLAPESDLWNRLSIDPSLKNNITELKNKSENKKLLESERDQYRRRLYQAEEALLCQDIREKHHQEDTYRLILSELQELHNKTPEGLPDVKSCLSYAGDSFEKKLIEICASHGFDHEYLMEKDWSNPERDRFQASYPLGMYTADLHMVACALRIADILDFDRERTPSILFYYLLPTNLSPEDNTSVLEWSKHLSISNWNIEKDVIIFRGKCTSHIVHHTIVNFCYEIAREIKNTINTYSYRNLCHPFTLPAVVKSDIVEDGYVYIPYKFELDDQRIYELLMGGAIYDEPLVAIRELIQNAVDACKLRDALTNLHDPTVIPSKENRITVTYAEPTSDYTTPILTVADSGIGMDQWIIENYFLKVGQSYYRSEDFNKIRYELRNKDNEIDFAPVSEFGIGFLSSFMVADKLKVTTAMYEPIRGDTQKRTLYIDGPTRLIRENIEKNVGVNRFKGTSVSLYLTKGGCEKGSTPLKWDDIRRYVGNMCQELPYALQLIYINHDGVIAETKISPISLAVKIPFSVKEYAYCVKIRDIENGIEGEVVLFDQELLRIKKSEEDKNKTIKIEEHKNPDGLKMAKYGSAYFQSTLLRGGFKVGSIPGFESCNLTLQYLLDERFENGRIRLCPNLRNEYRYPCSNIGRNKIINEEHISKYIWNNIFQFFFCNHESLPDSLFYEISITEGHKYFDLEYLMSQPYNIYLLARKSWRYALKKRGIDGLDAWENGRGPSLPVDFKIGYFLEYLFLKILFRITTIQIGEEGLYAGPPSPTWKNDIITMKINMDPENSEEKEVWCEYLFDNKNILYLGTPYVSYFNKLFKERLESEFKKSEINKIKNILSEALHQLYSEYRYLSHRKIILVDNELSLLRKVRRLLGDTEVGLWIAKGSIKTILIKDLPFEY